MTVCVTSAPLCHCGVLFLAPIFWFFSGDETRRWAVTARCLGVGTSEHANMEWIFICFLLAFHSFIYALSRCQHNNQTVVNQMSAYACSQYIYVLVYPLESIHTIRLTDLTELRAQYMIDSKPSHLFFDIRDPVAVSIMTTNTYINTPTPSAPRFTFLYHNHLHCY